MLPAAVRLSPQDRAVLARLALAASPHECCGLVVGHRSGPDLVVRSIHASENLSDAPDKSFEIDFRIRLHLEEDLATGPDSVIGLYHSHPDGRSRPSEKDLVDAAETGLLWLIAAVDGVGAVDLSAWLLGRSDSGEKFFSGLPVRIE